MQYDVLLVHPPSFYDFREKVSFPGPIARTVVRSSEQFVTIPFGMLSMADYLDRNGFRVLVDNLGDRMMAGQDFDAERHLRGVSAKVYAVGLHWAVHSQGAIETARLCKRLHPNSTVIVGGLTATCFHSEIIEKFRFVDGVIRGEAEKPIVELVRNIKKGKLISETPSLTCRRDGKVTVAPLMKPSVDLDEYEFTRLDLLEPKSSIFLQGVIPHWKIPVCRGCVYNCVSCGGSAYSYKTYFGMEKPAFRSPGKIAEDIQKLLDQGVRFVGLSQDPRMGGRTYWEELTTALRAERLDVTRLAFDLLSPADGEFLRALSRTKKPVVLTISPESGAHDVRQYHGREYSNEDCIQTVRLSHKYGIPITFFFMVGLARENRETLRDTWELWEELCLLDQKARLEGTFREMERHFPIGGPTMGQMILLDPGSLAFDFPAEHGYSLVFKNLEDYINGLSNPSWHQWISYETKSLDKNGLVELFLESIDHAIHEREKYGMYGKVEAAVERFGVRAQRVMINEVDHIQHFDEAEQSRRLRSLKTALDYYCSGTESLTESDPYSYRRLFEEILHESVGLIEGGPTDQFTGSIFRPG